MRKFIIALVGPSGSGKSTIEAELVKNKVAHRIMGFTTRSPRAGEVDGEDVRFLSMEEGARLYHSDELVQRVHFKGNYYGKTASEVNEILDSEIGVGVCVVEPTGIGQFLEFAETRDDVTILPYLVTASNQTLVKRLLMRFQSDYNNSDSGNIDFDYNAKRVLNLIQNEFEWGKGDNRFQDAFINEDKNDLREAVSAIIDDIHRLRCAYS